MEATTAGPNRTGTALAPENVKLMLEAVDELSPPAPINTMPIDIERQTYIAEADSVGSIPPSKSTAKPTGKGKAQRTAAMAIFLDKLGERIAFERTGTRLYDALITKSLALDNAQRAAGNGAAAARAKGASASMPTGEAALGTLRKIRSEELSHFRLLCDCVTALGGDPTAQTPSADVTAAASMGLMQVITDPRTTFAQCLNTILTAELTDNAGWELLSELAVKAGHKELTEPFSAALATEAEHLTTIRSWLASLLANDAGSPAV